jgi:PAS domain S-box-containing protein
MNEPAPVIETLSVPGPDTGRMSGAEAAARWIRAVAAAFEGAGCFLALAPEAHVMMTVDHGVGEKTTVRLADLCLALDPDQPASEVSLVEESLLHALDPEAGYPVPGWCLSGLLRDHDGACIGVFGITEKVSRRVTESDRKTFRTFRHLAEETARQWIMMRELEREARRASRLRTRFEHMVRYGTDLITVIDRDGIVLYQSPSLEDILGYQPDMFRGRNVFDLIHPEDIPGTADALRTLVKNEAIHRTTFRIRHGSGRWRWVEASGVNLLTDPAVAGVLLMSRDVTEKVTTRTRLKSEQEILEMVARRRKLDEILQATCRLVEDHLEGVRCCICTIGSQDRLQLFARPSFPADIVRVFDGPAPPPESISPSGGGKNGVRPAPGHTSLLEPILQALHLELCAETHACGAEGEATACMFVFRPADSPHEVDFNLLDAATNLAGVAIEAERQEQHLLAAKERAEQMDRLKSAFLTNMSHEIRTPLTSIIGFSEMLSEELPGEWHEMATNIRNGGRRLLETLNSVLDLAQLESGMVRLKPAPLDLPSLVSETYGLFKVDAEARGVDLHVHYNDPFPLVELDRGAVSRILINLIGNAFKFTENGGVRIVLSHSDSTATIRIEDSGVGIGAEFVPYLFDEFRQESVGLSRSHEGAGLGLTITHRLVSLMGGRIEVESDRGKGSIFTVHVPCRAHRP